MISDAQDFLRNTRSEITDQLDGFENGPLRLFDISVSPPVDVSQPAIDRLKRQLKQVDRLLIEYGALPDA